MVRADQIEKLSFREALGVVAHGINGVGHAPPLDLLQVNLATRLPHQRQAQKPKPLIDGSRFGSGFEWGLRGWDEKKPGEFQFLISGLRHQKMTMMDRIERAAE